MEKLSVGQKKSLSDFLNTVAAAWFTAGVISPLFAKPKDFIEFTLTFGISIVATAAFIKWSLSIVKGVKS